MIKLSLRARFTVIAFAAIAAWAIVVAPLAIWASL
jgi:hypothetical protein